MGEKRYSDEEPLFPLERKTLADRAGAPTPADGWGVRSCRSRRMSAMDTGWSAFTAMSFPEGCTASRKSMDSGLAVTGSIYAKRNHTLFRLICFHCCLHSSIRKASSADFHKSPRLTMKKVRRIEKSVGIMRTLPALRLSAAKVSERMAMPKPCSAKERALSPARHVQSGLRTTLCSKESRSSEARIPVPCAVSIKFSDARSAKESTS